MKIKFLKRLIFLQLFLLLVGDTFFISLRVPEPFPFSLRRIRILALSTPQQAKAEICRLDELVSQKASKEEILSKLNDLKTILNSVIIKEDNPHGYRLGEIFRRIDEAKNSGKLGIKNVYINAIKARLLIESFTEILSDLQISEETKLLLHSILSKLNYDPDLENLMSRLFPEEEEIVNHWLNGSKTALEWLIDKVNKLYAESGSFNENGQSPIEGFLGGLDEQKKFFILYTLIYAKSNQNLRIGNVRLTSLIQIIDNFYEIPGFKEAIYSFANVDRLYRMVKKINSSFQTMINSRDDATRDGAWGKIKGEIGELLLANYITKKMLNSHDDNIQIIIDIENPASYKVTDVQGKEVTKESDIDLVILNIKNNNEVEFSFFELKHYNNTNTNDIRDSWKHIKEMVDEQATIRIFGDGSLQIQLTNPSYRYQWAILITEPRTSFYDLRNQLMGDIIYRYERIFRGPNPQILFDTNPDPDSNTSILFPNLDGANPPNSTIAQAFNIIYQRILPSP